MIPLTVVEISWVVESEPTKSGPAKNGLPLTVGGSKAESTNTSSNEASVRGKSSGGVFHE